MSNTREITVAYAAVDKDTALRLANDLQAAGYTLAAPSPEGMLVAVISPAALDDNDLRTTLLSALSGQVPLVVVETEPTTLSDLIEHVEPVSFHDGYSFKRVQDAIQKARTPDDMSRGRRNLRFGIGFGVAILLLFVGYTFAIAIFDIEAPVEEFQELYTRDAATINAFAQAVMPRSTEQAANFELTLAGINRDLSTVVVATATEAAARGGFTPQPTGQIIQTEELSEVRQTATGGAMLRGTQTAQADLSQADIAATATQAAAEAEAELREQQLTVTAAAGE
jgi:hypothetical protein